MLCGLVVALVLLVLHRAGNLDSPISVLILIHHSLGPADGTCFPKRTHVLVCGIPKIEHKSTAARCKARRSARGREGVQGCGWGGGGGGEKDSVRGETSEVNCMGFHALKCVHGEELRTCQGRQTIHMTQ